MNIATWIYTKIFGQFVGIDEFGNSYFQRIVDKSSLFRNFGRQNRWVVYATSWIGGSCIPNKWFLWLHYQSDVPPTRSEQIKSPYHWEKPHIPDPKKSLLCNPAISVYNQPINKTYQSWRPS